MKILALRNFKRKQDDPHYRLFEKEKPFKKEIGLMWQRRAKNGNKYFHITLYEEALCDTQSS